MLPPFPSHKIPLSCTFMYDSYNVQFTDASHIYIRQSFLFKGLFFLFIGCVRVGLELSPAGPSVTIPKKKFVYQTDTTLYELLEKLQ